MVETIKDMHYDYKQKLNKIDSHQYRNLKVPEIDWKLREAELIFIKSIAFPRFRKLLGFEINQRTIDDIRTIVKEKEIIAAVAFDDSSFISNLPSDYLFYVSSDAVALKGKCEEKIRVTIRQHDDEHEESPFDKSSFEWREVNARFFEEKLRLFTDKTFQINEVCLNYIRRPALMHNAEDWVGGSYDLLNGTTLTGTQGCELPIHTRSEIVDLAVLITTGDLQIPDYGVKQAKLNLNN